MRKDIWTHGREIFEIFASERLSFQETLKESKVNIFIQQIFLVQEVRALTNLFKCLSCNDRRDVASL